MKPAPLRISGALLAVALALPWVVHGQAGQPGQETGAESGSETLRLKVGESARTRDGALRIGFSNVSADSRCPRGEQCIRAGDATVQIWLQPAHGNAQGDPQVRRELRELRSADPQSVSRAFGRDLRLVSLDPYPIAGQTVSPQAYVATLSVARSLHGEESGTDR